MQERMRFVVEAELNICSFSELCRRYGISRKTGYKWVKRHKSGGMWNVVELPRRPKTSPTQLDQQVIARILELRRRHPRWGPKKLVRLLADEGIDPPAASTIGDILKRAGLTKSKKRRRKAVRAWPGTLTKPQCPNHVWTVDFKGWFRCLDGAKCHPLTVMDLHSRYLLCLNGLPNERTAGVLPVFAELFAKYGVPEIIRVDNGAPFGSRSPLGITRLSLDWINRGIQVEFIEAGHPEQNGSHERMHRTLKEETTYPPRRTIVAQQRLFDAWRREYNAVRPHKSLDQRRPAEGDQKSRRKGKAPGMHHYPAHFETRKVNKDGQLQWEGQVYFISAVFLGEVLGLQRVAGNALEVYAGELLLGTLVPGRLDGLEPALTGNKSVTHVLG